MSNVHLVQNYLKEKGLDALCSQYAIKSKRHLKYPNLVLLKYNQIDSPMGEPIVQECRGLILDEAKDWSVVSYPFSKFFNGEEGHAAKIDWSSARTLEKEDGSLTILYYYDNQWNVSSSGVPDASGEISGGCTYGTFADLFWATWKGLNYSLPEDTDCCYMFELCTKENRVLVQHAKPRIVHHGARNLRTYQEYVPEHFSSRHNWECIRSYNLTSWDSIKEATKVLDPMKSEGYVVCDANFNRIKMKSPQYVALAHLKDGMSARRLLEIARMNESSEFLSSFPEWKPEFDEIKAKYDNLVSEIETFYSTIKDIPVQKDFALLAVKKPWSGALFNIRSGKSPSVRAFLSEMSIINLEGYLHMVVKPLFTVATE